MAGTFVSYSTSPGNVARDGDGRNSPYTEALLRYMKEPGLTIEQVFKGVRAKLGKGTGGKQIPWELSSLQGEFYFVPGSGKTLSPTAIIIMAAVIQTGDCRRRTSWRGCTMQVKLISLKVVVGLAAHAIFI